MLSTNFNKFIIIITIFLINYSNVEALVWENTNIPSLTSSEKEEKNFVVTCYYTPLLGQEIYLTWDYESEVKLNWDWIHTASGKKVFSWVLAAPSSYPFWTKIYLNWFWVWIVEDRWGAIDRINQDWETYDSIDVWMWEWDEWREKCVSWWRKTLKWYIVWINENLALNIESNTIFDYKNLYVTPESTQYEVKKLQTIFSKIWIYSWEINWNYVDIKNILINFQFINWVIPSKKDIEAWYFWPKTIAKLNSLYWENLENDNKLTKNEILQLNNWVNRIKNKLWINYIKTAEKLLISISKMKQKQNVPKKVKSKLEYLEYIL